ESPANVAMASRNQQKEVKIHTNYEQRAKTYGSKKVQNANTNNEDKVSVNARNLQTATTTPKSRPPANITTSPRNQQREVKVYTNYEQRAKTERKNLQIAATTPKSRPPANVTTAPRNQQKEVKIYMNYKQRAKTIVLAATHQGTTETTRRHQKSVTPTKDGTRNR
ncbi:7239_t:CDS:2, partial [Dentiscutata erythropus]